MDRKLTLLNLFISCLLLVGFGRVLAREAEHAPAAPQAALGTAFTYQGRLIGPAGPASGSVAVEFRLFSVETGGIVISSQTQTVQAANGIFTTQLDFGPGAFDGTARWLELVIEGTPLLPRQQLTPVPYALHSVNADLLMGQPATDFAPAVHAHAGSDYDHVVIVAKSGGDFTSVQAALTSISASSGSRYLVWVGPGTYSGQVTMKPYADIVGAGEDLTILTAGGGNTLSGATIFGASNATLRSLTVESVASGNSYAVGIQASGAAPALDHVRVVASGGTFSNYGVYVDGATANLRVTDSSISASGEGVYGIYVTNGALATLVDSSIAATGSGNTSYGIQIVKAAAELRGSTVSTLGVGSGVSHGISIGTSGVGGAQSLVLRDSTVTAMGSANTYGVHVNPLNDQATTTVELLGAKVLATGATNHNVGIYHYSRGLKSSSALTVRDSVVTATAGSTTTVGIRNITNPISSGAVTVTTTIERSTISASLGSAGYAIYNDMIGTSNSYTPVTVRDSIVSGSGSVSSYAIYSSTGNVSGSYTITVDRSQLSADPTRPPVVSAPSTTIYLGHSKLEGAAVATNGGSIVCASTHNESYSWGSGPGCAN